MKSLKITNSLESQGTEELKKKDCPGSYFLKTREEPLLIFLF